MQSVGVAFGWFVVLAWNELSANVTSVRYCVTQALPLLVEPITSILKITIENE